MDIIQGNLKCAANATYEYLEVHGNVDIVSAPNVRLKKLVIFGRMDQGKGSEALINIVDSPGFIIDDIVIKPEFPNARQNGINTNSPGLIRNADISGVVDGIMVYSNTAVIVEDTNIHDLAYYAQDPNRAVGQGTHNDCIQYQSGIGHRVLRSKLYGGKNMNSAVMITQDVGPVGDLAIEDSFLDGGACSINIGSKGNPRKGIRFNRLQFGHNQSMSNGAMIYNPATNDVVLQDVFYTDGTTVTPRKGS